MTLAKIKPFAVEQWMDTHESTAQYNLAETCVASISIDDLKDLSEDKSSDLFATSTKLTYGAIRGSSGLRSNLADRYSSKSTTPIDPDDVLITPGAIAANMVIFYALLRKGDHVICHYPTYQQLYEIPDSLGAEVDLWRADESNGWQLEIEDLKRLIRPNTKMIIINNPQNPTGSIVPRDTIEALIGLAQEHDIIIHSDEVYRPLFHSISPGDKQFPPSLLSLSYPKTIVTGSLSKAYSLAGIRVGWVASRSRTILDACAQARDYTTISVSQIDDRIAMFALSQDCIHALLGRNIQLAKRNLELLEHFVDSHRWACDWVKPVAGTTAFIKFNIMGDPVDDQAFCEALMQEKSVMLCPGRSCFGKGCDFAGYVRLGFCCETQVLKDGLESLTRFMKTSYKRLPTNKT